MLLNPNVYAKAQEEMDRVVGLDRLPTIEDRDSLPYLECILKETYRWESFYTYYTPVLMSATHSWACPAPIS